MRFCIVKVPYAGVDTENGKTISVDRYREVFETTLETRADAWVSPRTSLEVATEKLIDRYGKEKSHLLNWPTVYISSGLKTPRPPAEVVRNQGIGGMCM